MAQEQKLITSRKLYSNSKLAGITQGSIISGIYLPRYHAKEVWGCVITPRCDLARGISVPTIHILPVVSYEDWFEVEGVNILLEKNRKSLRNELHSHLPKDEFGENIFESGLSNEELRELIEDIPDIDKRETALTLFDAYVNNDDLALKKALNKNGKKTFVKELVGDGMQSYYAIESWTKNDFSIKIILLRDVLCISREIGLMLKNGFIENEVDVDIIRINNLKSTSRRETVYEHITTIASPIIEHILQRFAYNFIRIGVEDRDYRIHKTITDHLESL